MFKKKLVSVLLAMVMVLGLSVPAFAAEEVCETTPTMYGILVSDDGEVYEIAGILVENECATYSLNSQDEFSATYQFDVPSRAIQNGTSTIDGPDSSSESTIWLTIKWKTNTSDHTYLLTGVSGHWTIFDDTRVSVTSTNLVYGCSNPIYTQTNYPGVAVSNSFDVSTGFTHYILEAGGVMGANLTLNYLMGTSRRWSFTMTNNLFNDPISPISM